MSPLHQGGLLYNTLAIHYYRQVLTQTDNTSIHYWECSVQVLCDQLRGKVGTSDTAILNARANDIIK